LLYRNHPEISDLQISGALERRAVPIRELVENKARRLKEKKQPEPHAGATVTFAECEL
jgi:hypothetical protein